jgi:glutamyl/glutaminyl-tRNA synthetase
MDPDIDRILDNLPEKRSRLRLELYGALIKELLRRNRTYREIASLLLERFRLHASISTIHDYIRRWSAPTRKLVRARMAETQQNAGKDQINVSARFQMPNTESSMMEDEARQRIAALKSQPLPLAKTRIFHYDPEQPLHISSPPPEKNDYK